CRRWGCAPSATASLATATSRYAAASSSSARRREQSSDNLSLCGCCRKTIGPCKVAVLAFRLRLFLLCVHSRPQFQHEPYKDNHQENLFHKWRLLTHAFSGQLRLI